jgi:hypothetical protein
LHGAINMLGLAERLKVKTLQASTSEVYGDPTIHPQTEDYWGNVNPIDSRSCYDEGKRCAETLFFDYWRQQPPSYQGRPDFQHLWSAHAAGRPAGGIQFHRKGAARARHHDVRRRLADARVLLGGRHKRRTRTADGNARAGDRAGEHRQSGRGDNPWGKLLVANQPRRPSRDFRRYSVHPTQIRNMLLRQLPELIIELGGSNLSEPNAR